jgi:GAF domain-containing protein
MKQLLEMVALGRPLHEILNSLCTFAEEAAPECQCAVFPIDRRGQRFEKGVAPSLGDAFTEPLQGVPVASGSAPCSAAALHRSQVIAVDIKTDPRWLASSYRDLALAFGLRAVRSTPIESRLGEVLGTFAVCQRHPGSPTQIQQPTGGGTRLLSAVSLRILPILGRVSSLRSVFRECEGRPIPSARSTRSSSPRNRSIHHG